MDSLSYLTVQDILWIDLQVTKKVRHFHYARLEEAVFYQFAYGDSRSLLSQAARFISGFVKLRPFDGPNEATAFVACIAFLEINSHTSTKSPEEMQNWLRRVLAREIEGPQAIEEVAEADSNGHHALVPDVRNAVRRIVERYASVIHSIPELAIQSA